MNLKKIICTFAISLTTAFAFSESPGRQDAQLIADSVNSSISKKVLVVNMRDSSTAKFVLTDRPKITFTDSLMEVNSNNVSRSFVRSRIRNCSFGYINDCAFLLPEVGKYYRLRGKASGNLIAASMIYDGKLSMVSEDKSNLAGTIFYLAEGNRLLSYYTGTCLENTSGIGASIANGDVLCFHPSESYSNGYFTITTNRTDAMYLYDDTMTVGCMDKYVDSNCEWEIEEVTTLPVTISDAGYSTFYAPVEVTLPDGITAHTVTVDEDRVILSDVILTVPASEGVLLSGGQGTYLLEITRTGAEPFEYNNLEGTIEKTLIIKTANDSYYVLLSPANEKTGFYIPVNGEDENSFYNAGHEAFLHISGKEQSQYLKINDKNTTVIEKIEIKGGKDVIFDLSGRNIKKITAPGIYIKEGRKILVR